MKSSPDARSTAGSSKNFPMTAIRSASTTSTRKGLPTTTGTATPARYGKEGEDGAVPCGAGKEGRPADRI